jgi:hypothetical protein
MHRYGNGIFHQALSSKKRGQRREKKHEKRRDGELELRLRAKRETWKWRESDSKRVRGRNAKSEMAWEMHGEMQGNGG